MEPHDLAVLAKALEAWDRAEQARVRIDADRLMVTSRLGEQKPHPLLGIERDSRAAFLAGMRQLNLDYRARAPARADGRGQGRTMEERGMTRLRRLVRERSSAYTVSVEELSRVPWRE